MPEGVAFGIIYDGVDLGTNSDKTQTSLYFTKSEKGSKYAKTLTMSYQIYIKKTANLSSSIVFDTDEIAVFQLDGVGGINNNAGLNYRYTLTGLTNFVALECSANIPEVTDVDFGELKPRTARALLLPERTFHLQFRVPVMRLFRLMHFLHRLVLSLTTIALTWAMVHC